MGIDLLITGGSGFVGANLASVLSRRSQVAITFLRSPAAEGLESAPMDVSDEESVASVLDLFKPRAVIHAAGNKNVKFCEEYPEEAIRINALGTRNVARACRRTGSKLVYISTDVVFEGERGWYREEEIPRPRLAYGQSKLEGERWAQAEFPGTAICRTGGVYGKNSPLLKWLAAELSGGKPIDGFTDVVNTPTYVENLAEMIEAVIEKNLDGVLHTVGSQRVSRHQLFQSYARVFGLDETLVRPVAAGERRVQMLLQADSSLSVEKTAPLLGVPFDSVDAGLERLRQAGGV